MREEDRRALAAADRVDAAAVVTRVAHRLVERRDERLAGVGIGPASHAGHDGPLDRVGGAGETRRRAGDDTRAQQRTSRPTARLVLRRHQRTSAAPAGRCRTRSRRPIVPTRSAHSSAVISASPSRPSSTTSSPTSTGGVADVDHELVHGHGAGDRMTATADEHLAAGRRQRARHAVGVADGHRGNRARRAGIVYRNPYESRAPARSRFTWETRAFTAIAGRNGTRPASPGAGGTPYTAMPQRTRSKRARSVYSSSAAELAAWTSAWAGCAFRTSTTRRPRPSSAT